MEYKGFVGPAYTLQNISAECQRSVNLFPQQDETGTGKNQSILLSRPGIVRRVDVSPNNPNGVRCTYTSSKGRVFAVIGATLYEIDSRWNILGNYPLPNDLSSGPVSMTDNGSDMMILCGATGYWFHFSDTGSVASIAVNQGGTGWLVGDTFNIGDNAIAASGTVATVDTSGVVTGVTLNSGGSSYTTTANVSTTAQLPSTGTGLTVDVTVAAANTLTQIMDEVFNGGVQCGFCDGYILFNQPNTQQFWITNLYSTTINPLGFASAEGQPDTLLGLLVDHREIWLFSSTHTEVWYDSGNANFPFAYIQGAYISHGISNAWASSRLDNTVFWIGSDEFGTGIAWRANGYAPLRVSTYAMEQAWQRYPQKAFDVVAWTYQQDGHSYWVLNFPSGDATWVYDAATGLWHEWGYLGTLKANDGQLHRCRPVTHTYGFGRHVVGDWQTGYLYEMSPVFFDDDTREVKRLRSAPYIDNELKRVVYHQFELDMEVGQGNPNATEPVVPPATPVDPQISLRWSDDGGYSWSDYMTISMGLSGQYRKRVIWRRLGRGRQRVFEVSTGQHGINLSLYNAYLEPEGTNA